ncbi:MAG TPA: diacylglycerol kinase family protein, partial [Solirubrobacterales bacterium]
MKVALVAHAGKTVGGGLPELRRTLDEAGVSDPHWTEVPKSKRAPAAVEEALKDGAELLIAWGGDGMVRRCVNALKDTDVPLAIVPAGTSNLFATHLGIERDIEQAVQVALNGDRRRLDVGRFDGERFAVMAGAGFDAAMIKASDDLKDRLGRAAYVVGGASKLDAEPF